MKPYFELKHPLMQQAQEVVELVTACDISDHGVPDITLADILDTWSSIPIDTNVWIAQLSSGPFIGYAFLDVRGDDRMDTCVFVHPEYRGLGIGTLLLETSEARAREIAKEQPRWQLMNHVPYANLDANQLVKSQGFTFKRLYQRMKIILKEQPDVPVLPKSLVIRNFRPDQDESALYEVYDTSFRDSWGYSRKDAEEWISEQKGINYDSSLWFIAWEEDQAVGFLISTMQEDGLFVELLGVKRLWRQQGLGHALLFHAFRAAYDLGQHTVLLYVDSGSLTNAQHVYLRAGMKPDLQTALYCKQLT